MNGRFLLIPVVSFLMILGCTNNGEVDILAQPPYASLTDSIQRFPSDADLLLRRGELLSQNDKHELAYLDFKSAWEKKQTEDIAMAYISNLYLVNRPKQAVNLLEESVKKFPENPGNKKILSCEIFLF